MLRVDNRMKWRGYCVCIYNLAGRGSRKKVTHVSARVTGNHMWVASGRVQNFFFLRDNEQFCCLLMDI